MIKSKKNVPKRNSKDLEDEEKRNSYLDKRSQIINPGTASPAKSVEMDIEQVPEPPARKESRAPRTRTTSNPDQSKLSNAAGRVMELEETENIGIKKLCEVSLKN